MPVASSEGYAVRSPFDDAVRDHGVVVLRVCRALVGPDDADDAWSESFLSAMRAWPDLDDDADVRGWLVVIARHKCLDMLRARGRRAEPVDGTGLEGEAGLVGTGPAGSGAASDPDEADEHDFWTRALPDERLWHLVRALPTRQREALAYHHLAGLPHTEVAALTNSTPAAVRRASSDAIARLRRELSAPEEGR